MYVIEQINRVGLYSETNAGDNTNIPLQSVDVKAAFRNLFCQTTITQTYLNSEPNPIEAVYTFPLSARAALLNLEVKIGKRELQGLIVEKNLAEERYENAITNGNTAIMLEQLQVGMYTMNVGNILKLIRADLNIFCPIQDTAKRRFFRKQFAML